jgi:nicotinamide-nucleotide amidase
MEELLATARNIDQSKCTGGLCNPPVLFNRNGMEYNKEVVNAIKQIIVANGETIAVAESVTAGHLQAALSVAMEASDFFQGGITCYNLGQKARHLNIEPIYAEKENCIHQQVANTMAIEVSKLFISHYGLGITGYASVVPEKEQEGLYAYFAIAYNQEVVWQKRLTSSKEKPFDVQVDYTNQMLEHLLEYLQENKLKGAGK